MGSGNEIAKIYVDGSPTTIYSPVMSNAQRALVAEGNRAYLKLPNGVFAGVLTGSSKNIYFFIPLPYDFTTFQFQNLWRLSCPGTYIRGTSGNLVANEDLSTYSNSDSSPTATKRFTLTFTTGICRCLPQTFRYPSACRYTCRLPFSGRASRHP